MNNCNYGNCFLAALIIIFSFWQISFSKWIIVISAVLILIKSVCSVMRDMRSAGSRLFMVRSDDELHEGPTKKELKETLKMRGSMATEKRTGSKLIMEKSRPVKSKPSRREVAETLKK